MVILRLIVFCWCRPDTLVQVLRESAVAGQGPDAAVSRTDTGTVAVADADDAGVAVAIANVLVLVPA